MGAAISCQKIRPAAPLHVASLADTGSKMLPDTVGNEKLRILGPAVGALGKTNLLFTKGLAMCCGRVLPVWGTVTDVAIQDHESRPPPRCLKCLQSLLNPIDVVGV